MNTISVRLLAGLCLLGALSACNAGGSAPAAAAIAMAEPPTDDGSGEPTSQPSALAQAQTQPHAEHAEHAEPAEQRGPVMQDPLADGASGHYGAPFTSDEPAVSLTQALATCVDTGTPCKVMGTIERVCQNRGCWFTFSAPDVEPTVRVRMLDYGFLIPRNVVGASAIIEGTLARTVIPQEVAQHYADDEAAAGTAPARTVTGPEDSFEFTITGAQITRM